MTSLENLPSGTRAFFCSDYHQNFFSPFSWSPFLSLDFLLTRLPGTDQDLRARRAPLFFSIRATKATELPTEMAASIFSRERFRTDSEKVFSLPPAHPPPPATLYFMSIRHRLSMWATRCSGRDTELFLTFRHFPSSWNLSQKSPFPFPPSSHILQSPVLCCP